ncbi:MAG: sulfatase-like hydrolase/transferase [Acidobacteria bacterium]|nr:sulfatase-like hydrolase/transferase [Acidobacteriota bacterium]
MSSALRIVPLLLLLATFCPAQEPAPRPNIVVLLSDDMGYAQLGFTGGTEVPTPNIDRIAREGLQLTQFYVQPVCSPSRAALMTGRYPWKNGMEERPTAVSKHGMLRDERTIAEALREAGYATWMVGKWHLGEWQSPHLPNARGFDHHYGHYSALIDSFTHTRNGVLDWHRNGVPVIEEGYSTFLLAREAERLIENRPADRPFFLYLPFNAVHGPHQAPDDIVARYRRLGKNAAQRAQLEAMDTAVGTVLAALDREGLADDTLLIFTNDNGGTPNTSNGPYRGFKSAYHEGGVRVPAALRWPGRIPADKKSDALIHVTDFFPTFCRLADADAEAGLPLDGYDVWDTLADGKPSPRTEVLYSLMTIRSGDWKLIEEGAQYYNWGKQPLQLYDIVHDPSEETNRAAEHPEIVAKLRRRLEEIRKTAREPEKSEKIPGYPPAVYGEREDRVFGEQIRRSIEALGAAKDDATRNGGQ